MDETFSESEIYCNQLLRRKRGFPLYVPGPQRNLPEEYQKTGVSIGDVGRITEEGIFDFFFNIYHPADHPINNNDVPENFAPLPRYASEDLFDLPYRPGSHVSTSSVQRLDPDEFPGGDFAFGCRAPQGAVLAFPQGAHLQKLVNLDLVREYAAAHAENWYKYINGPRGRGLANGSLYLVTGSEKASAWGMASFYSVRNEFQLTFTPDSARQYKWRGNPAEKKSYNPSPINDGPLNQTTFIHGLSITLGTGIWGRLFGTVEIREIVESRSASAGESSTPVIRRRPPRRQSSLLSWAHSFFRGGAEAGERQYVGENGRVILSDLSPISKIFHPGELINNYILQKTPQAAVVMSHDDDWCNILGENDSKPVHTVSELLERIRDQYKITERDGKPANRIVIAANNCRSQARLSFSQCRHL
ncbi:hypothetical protein B0H13DRAFT_507814 [Mycena leptocephala]|nr:hypothetical protein B0H13DRAFT_507814 [Mycena leptocephala]